MPGIDWALLGQVADLLWCNLRHGVVAMLVTPWLLFRNLFLWPEKSSPDSCVFYEGYVTHCRTRPANHKLRYPVRTAFISLDSPPAWFRSQAADHMTASEARAFAGTDGAVWLLSNPSSAGYAMNPISVYYCYNKADGKLAKCIAEVTNTPWAERVTFAFRPEGESVRKALHVSPLMDMGNTWHLEAPSPDSALKLVVRIDHPELGKYFYADLIAVKSTHAAHSRNEAAGLRTFLKYGFQPHRIALWIYWHAVLLLRKGVPLYPPPDLSYRQKVAQSAKHPVHAALGCPFVWHEAAGWPWNTHAE